MSIGWPPFAGGVGTRPSALGADPGQIGMGSPGRRPFPPGPLPPSILHPVALQWHEWAERALIQQKQNRPRAAFQTWGLVWSGYGLSTDCHLYCAEQRRAGFGAYHPARHHRNLGRKACPCLRQWKEGGGGAVLDFLILQFLVQRIN